MTKRIYANNMNKLWLPKSGVLLIVLEFIATCALVACGGGGDSSTAIESSKQPEAAGLGSAIAWTPASITDAANPGSRQDISVLFTSKASVSNVTVTVVPELRSIVSVRPTSFASLQAGQVSVLTLTVAPSAAESLRTLQGTIRLLQGSATIANPLPVNVSLVAPELINGTAVPPEPQADLNNASLAGFDANGNGIRDDIERYLAMTYPQSAKTRAALLGVSKQFQAALLSTSPSDVSATIAGYRATAGAIDCLWYINPSVAEQVRRALFARQLNTKARSLAYVAYNRALSGVVTQMVSASQFKLGCSGFDPDSLPN